MKSNPKPKQSQTLFFPTQYQAQSPEAIAHSLSCLPQS